MVLVAKENRRAIFEYLLREGVIVVKKDAYMPAHQTLTQIPNLQAMMVVKSLKSKGALNEVYNWGWSYYFLKDEGITFLIKELGLPADAKILPNTHSKKRKVMVQSGDSKTKGEDDEDEKPAKDDE
jgi:small subunit ribosomal protein S10e